MGQRLDRLRQLINSPKGKNALSFLVFLAISAILWVVMALNDEAQRDLRCSLSIVNVPDSVVQVTPLPDCLNLSIRARGTSLIKYVFSNEIMMTIDYRNYINKNQIKLGDIELKSYFRNRLGANTQIMSLSPDSLLIYFTSNPGLKVPVVVDANVAPGPQYAIIGKVRSLTDSVTLYAINPSDLKLKSINTAPIVLNNLRRSQTLKVPLLTPPLVKAVPDSVEVRIEVEPLVAKTRHIPITAINVPAGYRPITVPNEVEVYYMVPMSIYKAADTNPEFTIVADFGKAGKSNKVPVTLRSAPKDFINVFVEVDSVEYILEMRDSI